MWGHFLAGTAPCFYVYLDKKYPVCLYCLTFHGTKVFSLEISRNRMLQRTADVVDLGAGAMVHICEEQTRCA